MAASILTAIYHRLTNGTLYENPVGDYFDKRAKATQTKRLVARLKSIGFDVQITPVTV